MCVCVWAVGCITVLRGVSAHTCTYQAQCLFPCWCRCCQLYQCSWTSMHAPISACEEGGCYTCDTLPIPLPLVTASVCWAGGEVNCLCVTVPVFVLAVGQSCSPTGATPGVQDVPAGTCVLYGAGGSSPDWVPVEVFWGLQNRFFWVLCGSFCFQAAWDT